MDDAIRIKRQFLNNLNVGIFAAIVEKTLAKQQTLNNDYAGHSSISLLCDGGDFIGYEIVDVEFFCDTWRRPDISDLIRKQGFEVNSWGLLKTIGDARRMINLMLELVIPCEPDEILKWTPFAVYKF